MTLLSKKPALRAGMQYCYFLFVIMPLVKASL
ncbi:hypothetical protein Y071_03670 [Salmonella enterica subsp. enterica serovar Infantis str. CVM N20078]|nr:hypothetical protein CFSAN002050_22265 [Salmonella enterica subsp. enterica serovar Cubana str. CFSAN002050]ESV51568.1 hypothetical protein K533_08280 [Salmonella enterica subsp. enterica serovar Cubana str. CVM42234]OLW68049.1 hypothetical protein Y071_03670 [Salmonella enterica subsp. enterica serovar Infantis str. CVM N20078]